MQRGRKREKSRGSVGAGGGRRRNIVQKMLYASIIRGQSCWVVEEELASFVGPLGAAFTSAQWLLPQHGQLESSHQAVDAKPDTHTHTHSCSIVSCPLIATLYNMDTVCPMKEIT